MKVDWLSWWSFCPDGHLWLEEQFVEPTQLERPWGRATIRADGSLDWVEEIVYSEDTDG